VLIGHSFQQVLFEVRKYIVELHVKQLVGR